MTIVVMALAATQPALPAQTHQPGPSVEPRDSPATNLRGVFTDSLRLLAMEHSTRIAVQGETRRELGGPGTSAAIPRQPAGSITS